MSSLMFCRDGILRLRRGVYDRAERKHYPILLPLAEMEERHPGMFLSLLGATLELEDGLDVRETLLNLAPWVTEVSAITSCRFDLFLDEAQKPLADEHFNDLDTIGFVYQHEIDAEPSFERDSTDMFQRIPGSRNYELREAKPMVTERFNLNGNWHCRGYKKGTEDFFDNTDNGFALDLSPLNKWHHLKLKVIDHYWLYDRTVGSDHLTHRDGLLTSANPMVEDVASAAGHVVARRIKVQAPAPTLHSLILGCLVWEIGFHGSPEETAEVSADLGDRVRECDEDRALRDSLLGADGEVDPDALARTDAEIEAELAAEKAREEAEHLAHPYEDKDIKTLEFAREAMTKNPDLVRAPDGFPEW